MFTRWCPLNGGSAELRAPPDGLGNATNEAPLTVHVRSGTAGGRGCGRSWQRARCDAAPRYVGDWVNRLNRRVVGQFRYGYGAGDWGFALTTRAHRKRPLNIALYAIWPNIIYLGL